jgi:hypothetical protein
MRARRAIREIAKEAGKYLHPQRPRFHGVDLTPLVEERLRGLLSIPLRRGVSAATYRKRALRHIPKVEKIRDEFPFMPEQVTAPLLGWLTKMAEGGITGPGGRHNAIAEICANFARGIVIEFSTRPPSSASKNNPMRRITSLAYEAVTGARGHDFERAVKEVVRSFRDINRPEPGTIDTPK